MADISNMNSLNTRIKLKYDLLTTWTTKNPVLLKGEVAIVEIPQNNLVNDSQHTPQNTPPAMLMKVGDGEKNFNALPYVQAVAGDVYAWAKKSTTPTLEELTNIDNDLTEYVNNIINTTDKIQDTDTFYKVSEEKTADGKHKFVLHAYNKDGSRYQDATKDITIDWSDLDTWMAGETERVQGLIEDAFSTLVPDTAAGEGKFVSAVDQVDGKIKVTRSNLVAADITDTIQQNQVAGLETIQSDLNTAKGQLANTDYGNDTAISADNKLMTASAVQRDIETAIGVLDDKIVVEQGEGNYVTSVERNAESGAIVVTRETLTHDKIGDWQTEVTDKLALKVNEADLFYSNDTKPSATNYIVRKEDIDGLAHGLHFRGFVESDPTAWAEPSDNPDTADVNEEFIAGDIVIREVTVKETINNEEREYVTTLEYIFDGTEWKELGSEGFHATKASVDALSAEVDALEAKHDKDKDDIDKAIEDAIVTAGDNAATAIESALEPLDYAKPEGAAKFAVNLTQENGKVTSIEYVNLAEADIPDAMSTGKINGLQAHMDAVDGHFNAAIGASGADNALVDGTNPLTTKAYVDEVADASAEAAVVALKEELNVSKAADAAKFATVVEQADGKIAVTYTNIVAADITDAIPTSQLADADNINTVLNGVDGGLIAITAENKLATKATVTTAVDALNQQLNPIAKDANAKHLVQTEGEYLIFDCGTAEKNI